MRGDGEDTFEEGVHEVKRHIQCVLSSVGREWERVRDWKCKRGARGKREE